MSYRSFTAGQVMDIAAALLNDINKTTFTYTAMQPYLQLASQELQEYFELNNLPISNDTSAVIEVDAGVTEIGFVGDTAAPNLPEDLVEIQQCWYSQRDQNAWIPMTKRNFLPHYLENANIGQLTLWAWYKQRINFLAANTDADLKLDYVCTLFPDIVDYNTQLNLINGRTFFEYRTAALTAQFVGENQERADQLNAYVSSAVDRAAGINVKGQQSIAVRRRPFRANFKNRRVIA